jgi:hypothetical protein
MNRGVAAVATGGSHSCALTRAGSVKCWGRGEEGALGNGRTRNSPRPVDVIGFTPTAEVAIVSRSTTVTPARIAVVELRCSGEASCKGRLSLRATVRGRLVGSSLGRVRIELGHRAFSIPAGRTQSVAVKLTARGYELLVRARRLPTQIRVTYKQPAGQTTSIRAITLRAPRHTSNR